MTDVDGKVVWVTGAGSGIGRGIARTLDALGLQLALIGRDESKLAQTRAELTRGKESALAISCDVCAIAFSTRTNRSGGKRSMGWRWSPIAHRP